ncbi:Maf-like protein [uncultured Flavobacterium sp.]|uniref:Maf-like protein n=1 Tax=uncultured Flavobacterium sp. TaxID=165435 RepID=UPI0029316D5D|nr:Maf-like protein [uncultured Flavobacterium sp.]
MLKEKLKKYTIILASGSPRRQQFFKDLNLDFEIRLKDIEEVYPPELKGVEITDYLAELKANAFEGELKENEILVTSDTIVWHQDKALGKPKNAEEAFAMIKSMSNETHDVITSVCFKTSTTSTLLHDITKVTFNDLTDEAILYYIDNYKPYDKAGAYGIQEWFGFMAVAKVEGSYTNVMGLPTAKVYEYLSTLV